jgi:hypothetical protein
MLSKELNIVDEKDYADKWVQTEPCSVFSTGRRRSSTTEDSKHVDLKGVCWPKNPFRFCSPSFDDVSLRLPLNDENPQWLQNWGEKSPIERRNAITQIDSPNIERPAITHVISPPSIEKITSESKMKGMAKSPIMSPSLNKMAQKENRVDRQLLLTPAKQYHDENVDYREKSETKDIESPQVFLRDDDGNPMKGLMTPRVISKKGLKGDTPMPVPGSARLQRSVSRVKSYKEPSLTTKVRKGFQFFIYEDASEES